MDKLNSLVKERLDALHPGHHPHAGRVTAGNAAEEGKWTKQSSGCCRVMSRSNT